MDFPITELMDRDECVKWIHEYCHPEGLKCPHCQAGITQARWFRKTKRSGLDVYRCQVCAGIYNLYSGTVFEGRSVCAVIGRQTQSAHPRDGKHKVTRYVPSSNGLPNQKLSSILMNTPATIN